LKSGNADGALTKSLAEANGKVSKLEAQLKRATDDLKRVTGELAEERRDSRSISAERLKESTSAAAKAQEYTNTIAGLRKKVAELENKAGGQNSQSTQDGHAALADLMFNPSATGNPSQTVAGNSSQTNPVSFDSDDDATDIDSDDDDDNAVSGADEAEVQNTDQWLTNKTGDEIRDALALAYAEFMKEPGTAISPPAKAKKNK
jgi:polyhydroxyalkanoate synthesis regulator phasin